MKKRISMLINIFIAYMAPRTWLRMVFVFEDSRLTSTGLSSLKYFTVLSNLLMGLASLIYVIGLLTRKGTRRSVSWADLLKCVATTSVTLTLRTVLVFLGPLYGYQMMFSGVNFWLHAVIPVLAIIDLMFLDTDVRYEVGATFLSVVPMILYGIFYIGNILINGRGEWPNTNDWYGFAMWGIPIRLVIFVIISVLTWRMSLGLVLVHNAMTREVDRIHRY